MILSALQSAAVRLVGRKPSTFFGASGVFEMEMCDLINEVAQDIAKYQDWAILMRTHTFSGDGLLTVFNQPLDYDRMTVDSQIQSSANWLWGYAHYANINDFLLAQNTGFHPWPGGWIIFGYGSPGATFQFSPAPMGDAVFPYISNQWAINSAGTVTKPFFDSDTDSFLLPERLLTLGLVWRWRENKKLDYTGDQEAFTKALDEYAGKDAGATVYRVSGRRRWPTSSIPWMGVAY